MTQTLFAAIINCTIVGTRVRYKWITNISKLPTKFPFASSPQPATARRRQKDKTMLPPSSSSSQQQTTCKRRRRAAKQNVIVISSDDDDFESEAIDGEDKVQRATSNMKRKRQRKEAAVEEDNIVEQLSDASSDSFVRPSHEIVSKQKAPPKRQRQLSFPASSSSSSRGSSTATWVDEFSKARMHKGSLLVSSRKAKEIAHWLAAALASTGPRFLILSGPPGCGKSSALRSILLRAQCAAFTWTAPQSQPTSISHSLLRHLQSFIVGTRYANMQLEYENESENGNGNGKGNEDHLESLKNRVLIIDDLPVTFHDERRFRDELAQMLDHCAKFSPHPVVLILSDSSRGIAKSVRFLLGFDRDCNENVRCIAVPRVTDVVMKKRLNHVMSMKGMKLVEKGMEDIIRLSNGDFRAALNCLQFSSCTGGSSRNDKAVAERGRRKKSVETRSKTIGRICDLGSDGTLGTYHAISKILNNKRDAEGWSKYEAESIINESKSDPSTFIEFLHHNYLEFYGEADDIVPTMEYVSEADTLLPWWADDLGRGLSRECAGSVAARAFLCFNSAPVRKGWRPIRGPESRAVEVDGREHLHDARRVLQGAGMDRLVCSSGEVLEVLAYVELMKRKRVKAWGLGGAGGGVGGGLRVGDVADAAMVEAEAGGGDGEDAEDAGGGKRRVGLYEMGGGGSNGEPEEDEIEDW